jgi:hypothetical protein
MLIAPACAQCIHMYAAVDSICVIVRYITLHAPLNKAWERQSDPDLTALTTSLVISLRNRCMVTTAGAIQTRAQEYSQGRDHVLQPAMAAAAAAASQSGWTRR